MKEVHILLAGFVVETRRNAEEEALTDVICPDQPIGLACTMLGTASPTGARTITSARLVLVSAHALRATIRRKSAVGLTFLDFALAGLLRQTVDLCNLKLLSSVQRLAVFLLEMVDEPEMVPARFVLPYEKRFIAAKIGCSQENLSRAFAALRQVGVESKNGIVVIKDPGTLNTFAGLPAMPTPA